MENIDRLARMCSAVINTKYDIGYMTGYDSKVEEFCGGVIDFIVNLFKGYDENFEAKEEALCDELRNVVVNLKDEKYALYHYMLLKSAYDVLKSTRSE